MKKGSNSDILSYINTKDGSSKKRTTNDMSYSDAGESTDMGRTGPSFSAKLGSTKKSAMKDPYASKDKHDKIIQIERENNSLKQKTNLLDGEITTMKTKLRRVEALIRSRSKVASTNQDYDVKDMQRDLESEVDDLKDQNSEIKEKVRKLNVVHRGLTSQMAGGSGGQTRDSTAKSNKFAHVQGKLDVSYSKVTRRYQDEAKEMRAQLVINQNKIMQLEAEMRENIERNGGISSGGVEQIRSDISNMQKEMRQIENDMDRMHGEFSSNKEMFSHQKNYTGELNEEIQKANEENERLKQENFRLQLKTQQVTDLENDLKEINDQKDQIERKIVTRTAQPFKKKEAGQSIEIQIADQLQKLKEKESIAISRKSEEQQLAAELKEKQERLLSLQGEHKVFLSQHKKTFEDYKEKNASKDPNEQDTLKSLFQMDPVKGTTLMTDLTMGALGGGAQPIWANLPFLENPATSAQQTAKQSDPKRALKSEIDRLKQEKSDFAAELEKAQNLLRLQTDIEKENTVYFQNELKRLSLVERSVSTKVEELAKRADDKQNSLADLTRKQQTVQESQQRSPMKDSLARRSMQDVDAMSEFSVQTNESEIGQNENILDFKVEDAEFYVDAFGQVPSLGITAEEARRQLITLVTVDFYNHSTETTQMSEGVRANYQTQFSFVNKVDSFYVTFLQKNSLKLDVYVSDNSAAKQLGRCEILLRELIESEITADVNMKTPVIQNWARIYPVTPMQNSTNQVVESSQPLGIVKFKMRLRKPISQAMRFYREQNEIKNVERAITSFPGQTSLKSTKKLITISVIGASGLKVAYSDISEIAPFFFYQFYTFDDRYSHNAAGINPRFNDQYSYEVTFDNKAMSYFEKEHLEIILFDDNAPISGVQLESGAEAQSGQNQDDMIGVARIPLNSLITGCSIHDKFAIKTPSGQTKIGEIEVKLAVMDLETIAQEKVFGKSAQELAYSKEWESEVIMQISRKLATLNCDIELIFGVFSQGQRSCTKANFKHTCINRLRLTKDGLTERELDLLLDGNQYTLGSQVIEKDDFVQMFHGAIIQARHERANQIALDTSLARDNQESFLGAAATNQGPLNQSLLDVSHSAGGKQSIAMALQDGEILELLGDMVKQGLMRKVLQSPHLTSSGDRVRVAMLTKVLTNEGFHSSEAIRVSQYLAVEDFVSMNQLGNLFQRAKTEAAKNCEALRKFMTSLKNNPKLIITNLEAQDLDKNGLVNLSGFHAALRRNEVKMSLDELREVFYLICALDDQLAYQHWIQTNFPQFANYFSITATSRRSDDPLAESSVQHISTVPDAAEISVAATSQSHSGVVNANKLASAMQKVERFLTGQDITVGTMFSVLDTDSSNQIDWAEFKAKVRAMRVGLDDDEIQSLFHKMDINGTRSVSFDELVTCFATVNTSMIIKRMQKIIQNSKVDPETYFDSKAISDRSKQQLNMTEVTKMIKELDKKLIQIEISHVVNHLDRGRKGFVTKNDFLTAIRSEFVQQQTFQISIEDVIKPLATKAKKYGAHVSLIFQTYDKDKNSKLSVEELQAAMAKQGINLGIEEVQMMKDYFKNMYGSTEVSKNAFIELLGTKFVREFDEKKARKSLKDLNAKVDEMRLSEVKFQEFMGKHNPEKSELIDLVSFKRAMNAFKCLDIFSINNLAKYLDAKNDGLISSGDFIAKVRNAGKPSESFRDTSLLANGSFTNKWANSSGR